MDGPWLRRIVVFGVRRWWLSGQQILLCVTCSVWNGTNKNFFTTTFKFQNKVVLCMYVCHTVAIVCMCEWEECMHVEHTPTCLLMWFVCRSPTVSPTRQTPVDLWSECALLTIFSKADRLFTYFLTDSRLHFLTRHGKTLHVVGPPQSVNDPSLIN